MPEKKIMNLPIKDRITVIEKDHQMIQQHFATKADLAVAKGDLQTEIVLVKSELHKEINDFKVDIIRWVVGMSFASPALLLTLFGLGKKFGLF